MKKSNVELALIETMYLDQNGDIKLRSRHCSRLERSARCLDFLYDANELENALNTTIDKCRSVDSDSSWRVRIELTRDGRLDITQSVINEYAEEPVKLIISPTLNSTPAYLNQHKSTYRMDYENALMEAHRQGAFDALFFNEAGFLTEGARTNVFLRIGETWYTPPVSDGLLPGVMREEIICTLSDSVQEKSLTHADLMNADEITVCNALRGQLRAVLL